MHIKGFLEYKKNLTKATLIAYGKVLVKFESFLKDNEIDDIKLVDNMILSSFINKLENKNLKVNTINRYISIINNYFEYLLKIGYIDNKVSIEKKKLKSKKNNEILTLDQFNVVISKIEKIKNTKRDVLLLNFLYRTELKLKEILMINTNDFYDGYEFVNVNDSMVALPPNIINLLVKYYDSHDKEMLFSNYLGNKMSRQAVWKMINKYNKKFNLNISTEMLNRSYKVNKLLKEYLKEEKYD